MRAARSYLAKLKRDNVVVIDNYIPEFTCMQILGELQFAYWQNSTVISNNENNLPVERHSEMRISQTANHQFFSKKMNQMISKIEKKLARSFAINDKYLEQWQATRYAKGGKFDFHLDCGLWKKDKAGERKRTILIYLDTPIKGGSTCFRALNMDIKAVAGRMVIWNNLLPNGNCNHLMIHAGMPLLKGEKNVLVTWQRQKQNRINNNKINIYGTVSH